MRAKRKLPTGPCAQAFAENDGSRALTGNMGWQGPNATKPLTPISELLDVMGMSHQSAFTLSSFHQAEPFKPIVMTECCSCPTQRSEDQDLVAAGADDATGAGGDAGAARAATKQWTNWSSEASETPGLCGIVASNAMLQYAGALGAVHCSNPAVA